LPHRLPVLLAAVLHGSLLDGRTAGRAVRPQGWEHRLHAGIFRISAGRYRGAEGTPKTASSVRDVDMLPPVRDALRTQLAQQAALRLQRGLGAAVPEQDYVFTTPTGRCLDINSLRNRIWYPTLAKAGLRRRTMYQTRH